MILENNMKMSIKQCVMLALIGFLVVIPGIILIVSKFPNTMNIFSGVIITTCGFAIISTTIYTYKKGIIEPKVIEEK